MNLEQIVKETVAKIVAEKELTAAEEKKREEIVKAMKKDFKGPAPAMYAIATDKAKKLAEEGDRGGSKTYGMKRKSFFGNDTENGPDPADLNPSTPIGPELEKLYDKKEIINNQWDYQRRQYTQAIKNNDNPAVRQQAEKEWEKINYQFQQKSNAIQKQIDIVRKAKGLDEGGSEDHEVSMAQRSLNSILRSAMELKAKIGNQEINIPAWIQDHITNSENYIDQASQGYHEYSNGGHEGEEMNEARVSQDNVVNYLANSLEYVWSAGKGNNSIDFQDFAQSLYFDMFGGDEMDEANLGHNETSSIEQEGRFWIVTYNTSDGTKEKSFESEDEARAFYNTLDEAFVPKSSFDDYSIGDNVTVAGKKAKITAMKMDDETGERRARVRFEDNSVKDVNINSLDEAQESNDDKIAKYEKYTYTLDGEVVKPEITFLNNILKAMLGNKIYNIGAPENGKVELSPESGKKGMYNEAEDISDEELDQLQTTADDTSKMPAERDAARNKIYASRAKKESQELDEWTIRRWQHYAGIK
jgi:hypothetical protein